MSGSSAHAENSSYKKYHCVKTEDDAFAFVKGDNYADSLTYFTFSEPLCQQDLWNQAEVYGNGATNFEVFKHVLGNLDGYMEDGLRPEDYSFSDNAGLTAVLSPARMLCSGSQNWSNSTSPSQKASALYLENAGY
ncbi:hypothetical protein VNO78_20429 [Psophocarpus tetragonolobus]|uniref:Uncharacterized protein n=1 Tax=Psophocarpus tetragonolobus TaxID=3891 RepID=A0AAN9XHH1_PSOTE